MSEKDGAAPFLCFAKGLPANPAGPASALTTAGNGIAVPVLTPGFSFLTSCDSATGPSENDPVTLWTVDREPQPTPGMWGAWGKSPSGFFPLCLFILLLSLLPETLQAQSLFGRVIVAGDTTGVSGAELVLADSTGVPVSRVQSTETGHFRLPAPGAGRFIVRISRIGFAALEVEATLREGETVEVEIRMAEEAIPLEPILVVARREIRPGTLEQFYDRMARNKQRGKGQFLTREEIEKRSSLRLGLIIQTLPGVWTRGRNHVPVLANPSARGGVLCSPEFFLDGRPMLNGFRDLEPTDLEGVEVYRGYSEAVDGEFPNSCGQIFLWRRSDWGNPITWRRTFIALGLGAILWAMTSLILN